MFPRRSFSICRFVTFPPKSTLKHYPFKTVANSLSRKVVFWKRETTSARYDALQPKWTLDMCQQLDDGANGMMVSIT